MYRQNEAQVKHISFQYDIFHGFQIIILLIFHFSDYPASSEGQYDPANNKLGCDVLPTLLIFQRHLID